jgi:hypothetical protein
MHKPLIYANCSVNNQVRIIFDLLRPIHAEYSCSRCFLDCDFLFLYMDINRNMILQILVSAYKTIWRYIPEDHNLNIIKIFTVYLREVVVVV